MGFFEDIKPAFKKRELTLKEKVAEKNNVYTFVLEKDPDVNWKAGQHGIFEISQKILRKLRDHSVSHLHLRK